MTTTDHRERRLPRGVRTVVAILAGLAIVFLVVHVWARANTDHSTFARAMAWFDSDTDDWQRFPARSVLAGAPVELVDETGTGVLDDVEVDGDPVLTYLADNDTTAFLVARNETLLVEEYFGGADRTTTQTSFSVAKSFVSTLLGAQVADGVLELDDPLTEYVPELLERDPRFADITIRDLVTMSSGLKYVERGLPWSDDAITYYAPDLRAAALSVDVAEQAGQTFLYNNYNLLLEGLILERVTSSTVADLLATTVWQPMGAEADGSWSLDSEASGFEKMESGINGRAVDFLRFGIVFAQEGSIGGRQVVPAAWVEEATAVDTTTDPAAFYQYHWWVQPDRGTFAAVGNHGQFILVDPDADLVVVRMGRSYSGLSYEGWLDVLGDVLAELR